MVTSSETRAAPGVRAEGLNIAGYFRSENGLGEGGRLLVATVEAAGVPYRTDTYAGPHSRQEHAYTDRGAGAGGYDVNIACVNAEQMPRFAAQVGPGFFEGRYTIGTWFWETEEFPPRLRGALDFVDEVWMPSDFSRDSLRAVTDKPVITLPLPIVAPKIDPSLGRGELGLPEGFLFVYTFDLFSTARRKNPVGVVEAFKRAFKAGDGAALVLKSANGDKRREDLEELHDAAAGRPDITVIDDYVAAQRIDAIIAAADCYVSLHRAEGFGLGLAVAMSLGKPVIGTGYSGNLTFMDESNSFLVDWKRIKVGPGVPIYPANDHWADPDLDQAAQLMRRVFENRDEAARKGAKAKADIERDHSPQARAKLLTRRLQEIRGLDLPGDHVWGERWEHAAPAQRAAVMVAGGTDVEVPTRRDGAYGSVARVVRRTMQRLMLNHEMHQREVEQSLLDSIRELQARVKSLEEELEKRR
jgi:glycosyltransferase involved in cell wall biosynthesis